MNELRRELLGYEPVEGLEPEAAFLAARQAALAVLFLDHTELYRRLYRRCAREGPSDELDAIALDAAGNLATLLQTLRAREELMIAVAESDVLPTIPVALIDQLQFSFLLLAGQRDGYSVDACLSDTEAGAQLETEIVTAWLRDLDPDLVMSEPFSSRFAAELDDEDPASQA